MKIIISIITVFIFSCGSKNNKNTTKLNENSNIIFNDIQPLLVYKTKSNYNDLVTVLLSEDKKTIVSYPHPKDIIIGSGKPLPIILNDGYLIDNRGINKNVAFLNITYFEYEKLENAPNINELYKMIIDKNPLLELCNCGTKANFKNVKEELNEIIKNKELQLKCKTIK